jgi:glycosyltransferase involved in cell wall biosynthesis
VPYCVTPHGGLSLAAQRRSNLGKRIFALLVERAYLNNAAFLHAVSSAEIDGVQAYGANNRFVTAPNCIDPSVIPREVDGSFIRRRFPEIAGRRLFVYIGRIDPEQKGLDMLLRAWASLRSREGLALIVIGPDWRRGRTRLQGIVDTLGIADSVKFFGAVSGRDKWDVLASSDVFVHPSRWEAGVPFSVLEAMLATKPLLLTAPADPDGLVLGADAGIVVAPQEENIRKALTRLSEADKGELDRLGSAARDLVVNHFSWELTTQTLLDGYRDAQLGG